MLIVFLQEKVQMKWLKKIIDKRIELNNVKVDDKYESLVDEISGLKKALEQQICKHNDITFTKRKIIPLLYPPHSFDEPAKKACQECGLTLKVYSSDYDMLKDQGEYIKEVLNKGEANE